VRIEEIFAEVERKRVRAAGGTAAPGTSRRGQKEG
tara:strand:+ start:115 stop:219 length:105 start_codon:yes stop_codon:yes gene_type:complete